MKIAVLFDGAGLARLGLERAGHDCTGFELDPIAHHLSQFVGSGQCMLQDARQVDLSPFDAVWASPPCQEISIARTQGDPVSAYSENLLGWSLSLQERYPHLQALWVENVTTQSWRRDSWGRVFNAAQFLEEPIQNRNRVIGGKYPVPYLFWKYKRAFEGVCPCITASEIRGCATDQRRASRFYGRRLTLAECAFHQGFELPAEWSQTLPGMTDRAWREVLYTAIGNGVPVFMAQAFGDAINRPVSERVPSPRRWF